MDKGEISQIVKNLIRSYAIEDDLDTAYKQMGSDKDREMKATEWAEALISDISNESIRTISN